MSIAVRTLAALLMASLASSVAAAAQDIAIITNPAVRAESIEFDDLRSLFLGERKFWDPGSPVRLAFQKDETKVSERFLSTVCAMTARAHRRYWLKRIFQGHSSSPYVAQSPDVLFEYLERTPGAIGYVLMDEDLERRAQAGGIVILAVEGKLPNEQEYPLTLSAAGRRR